MATVLYVYYPPKHRYYASLIEGLPYIMSASGEYLEGPNDFLAARRAGKIFPSKKRKIRPKTLRASANKLVNFATWLETPAAHPSQGMIAWNDVREWHVEHLYRNSQTLGLWSREYFATGVPSPLDPNTINDRVAEVMVCWRWLEKEGHVPNFSDDSTVLEMGEAFNAATQGRLSYEAPPDMAYEAKRQVRQQPGAFIPPSPQQHYEFFNALPAGSHRIAAMLFYETGERLAELIENTLLPGRNHTRSSKSDFVHPAWPRHAYRLEWSANNDSMLGVLPTQEDAWGQTHRTSTDCQYRILGKGLKIRLIDISEETMKVIWQYVYGLRASILRRNKVPPHEEPAQLLLNQFGRPLSTHAVQDMFRRTTLRLKNGYDFSGHTLRHSFACNYLATAILARAQSFGYGSDHLSLEVIERHGDFIVSVLQRKLGHAQRETTMIYLEQLMYGQVSFEHSKAWNAHLDDLREAI